MYQDNKNIVLGIEGTAHTLGIGITRGKEILADKRQMFIPESGGIHPRESARMMNENYSKILADAIKEAKIDLSEIDAIAFSQGPGLGPCLRTCATGARTLALTLKKPLIGVNHPLGHVELARMLTKVDDPLTLYVSGGNTQIIVFSSKKYRVIGETQDIAIGNLLDQLGREMGLSHPGGPKIEKLAKSAKELYELPYAVKGMDISYSGILTASIDRYRKEIRKKNSDKNLIQSNLCNSIQEYAFAMITEVLERALVATEKKDIIVTGGVAANQRLNNMLKEVANDHSVNFYPIPIKLAADNGVMIAWTGNLYLNYNRFTSIENSIVNTRYRIEEAEILWR